LWNPVQHTGARSRLRCWAAALKDRALFRNKRNVQITFKTANFCFFLEGDDDDEAQKEPGKP
jgi:hypothetical protein